MSGSRDQSDQTGGPGWRRMRDRLGPVRMEEMRLKTIAEQAEALERATAVAERATDRESYRGYPAPRPRVHKPRRKKP